MKQNVCSKTDRMVRVILGLVLFSMLFWVPVPYNHFGWVGLVLIGTAIFKYCPISDLFGVNTCTLKERKI
jgi:hypothetical protein